MIKLQRPKYGPKCLKGPHSPAALELADAKSHYGSGSTETFPFAVYTDPDVKLALEAMSHDKCAYCESRYGAVYDGAVEHYRPKGKLEKEKHPGYWWLAATWTNLLPSCQHCNESRSQVVVKKGMTLAVAARLHRERRNLETVGKGSQFFVRNKRRQPCSKRLDMEDALLIDPTRRDPAKHIHFPTDLGISLALPVTAPDGDDAYGLNTINVTALNRFDLVRERSQVLMDLRREVLEFERALDQLEEAKASGHAQWIATATEATAAALNAIDARTRPHRAYSAVAIWLQKRLQTWLETEREQGIKIAIPAIDTI